MSNIFFIEKGDDIDIIERHLAKDDVIIALSSVAVFALHKKGLNFKLTEGDYYSHIELYNSIAAYEENIADIMKYMDGIIFKIDKRFKDISLSPFYCSLVDTQVPILIIINRIFEIQKVFEIELPQKVKIVDQGRLISDGVRFDERGSLVNEIIKLLKAQYGYELIIYEPDARSIKTPFPKEQNGFKIPLLLHKLKYSILRSKVFFQTKLFRGRKKNTILNVDCWQMQGMKDELKRRKWIIRDFPLVLFNSNKVKSGYKFQAEFEENFKRDEHLKRLFQFFGVEYFDLIKEQFLKFCDSLEGMLNDYIWLERYVSENKFDIVVFQTHSGWNTQNKLLPVILRKKKIPYVCWMHGHCGKFKGVSSGYTASDYLLGNHYFVCGSNIKDIIDTHYAKYNLITHTAGSRSLENAYRDYSRPKNKKKVITYVLPAFAYPLNEDYMTECVRWKRFGYWIPMKAILDVLAKYKDKYRIVLRPYAGKASSQMQSRLLNDYLNNMGASDISTVSIEQASLRDVLFESDMVIYNNVSTAFSEAAMTDADIFLLEDGEPTPEAQTTLEKRTFYSEGINEFCILLDKYLNEGKFYQKNDLAFLKAYLDIDNRDNRADKISDIFDKILAN